MAFLLLGKKTAMSLAGTLVTHHVLREAVYVHLEGIRGDRHLFHVEPSGGVA